MKIWATNPQNTPLKKHQHQGTNIGNQHKTKQGNIQTPMSQNHPFTIFSPTSACVQPSMLNVKHKHLPSGVFPQPPALTIWYGTLCAVDFPFPFPFFPSALFRQSCLIGGTLDGRSGEKDHRLHLRAKVKKRCEGSPGPSINNPLRSAFTACMRESRSFGGTPISPGRARFALANTARAVFSHQRIVLLLDVTTTPGPTYLGHVSLDSGALV